MAVVFSVAVRDIMLNSLNSFVNPSSGRVADGFSIQAYSAINAGGTLTAFAQSPLASASSGSRVNLTQPTMTIPASGQVRSIALSTYDGGAGDELSLIAYKNLAEPLIYSSVGTLQVTAVTLTISNPT